MIANYIIRNKIAEAQFILDVGCGKGVWDVHPFQTITGVDILKQKILHYDNYIQHNLEQGLPKLNDKYNLVIAKDILEHLHHPLDILKQIHELMIEEGMLVVKVPDYRSKNAWADYTHIRPYTRGSIIQIVKDAGFEVESVVRLGGYFLPNLIPQAFSWLVVARK